jgi:hypothetical protein
MVNHLRKKFGEKRRICDAMMNRGIVTGSDGSWRANQGRRKNSAGDAIPRGAGTFSVSKGEEEEELGGRFGEVGVGYKAMLRGQQVCPPFDMWFLTGVTSPTRISQSQQHRRVSTYLKTEVDVSIKSLVQLWPERRSDLGREGSQKIRPLDGLGV